MYYIMNNDKLAIFDDNKEKLEQTRSFMPQLDGQYTIETDIVTSDELKAHPNKVVVDDIEIEVEVPDGSAIEKFNNQTNDDIADTETAQPFIATQTITVKGLVLNPNYEEEEAAAERERLDMLSLTKREVFLALYKDKGITPDALKAQIQDAEALIEFEYANDYFRGNPLIGQIGAMLGYTSDDLDYLFEHKELPEY